MQLKTIPILFFFCLIYLKSFSQQANFFSRSEIGVSVGQMYYIGDLNRFKPFNNSNLAGGLMYRFNLQSRLTLRFNYLQGSVEGYDSQALNPVTINRNLDFHSEIKELVGGIEFHYFPFQFGRKQAMGTAYILTQIGVFYMDPLTTIDGKEVSLQALGTEGQGTVINNKLPYSKFQVCLPLGLGAKASLGKNITFNVDIAIRKTFTDYLDDVKSATYYDPAVIAAEHGALAGELSNRSIDQNRFGKRGDPTTKDWYVYCGGMITFRLGKGNKCPMPR